MKNQNQSPFNKDASIGNYVYVFFFKLYENQCPKHLFDIVPKPSCKYRTRNAHNIPLTYAKHQFLKIFHIFYQPLLNGTNYILTFGTRKHVTSLNQILKFIKPTSRSVSVRLNLIGVKFLTTLRTGLSHLRKHNSNTVFKIHSIHFAVT